MSNWKRIDSANSVPLWVLAYVHEHLTVNNIQALYNNTIQNLSNSTVGVFKTPEGWVLRTTGQGGRSGRVQEEILFAGSFSDEPGFTQLTYNGQMITYNGHPVIAQGS